MPRVVLVTDTSSDVPAEVSEHHDIRVARARYAFEDHTSKDGDIAPSAFYARMDADNRAPVPFGVPEAAFREIFADILSHGDRPLCIVAPFDVNPSFTTAIAAMLSFDDADVKVLNPGVSSAGLCSLLVSLAQANDAGWDREKLLDAIDALGPRCDTLFVPADVRWLEQAGRLSLIEEKLGELDGASPVVRLGSRITGVAVGDSVEAALERAVELVGARAGEGTPLIVTIDHAANPEAAAAAARAMEARWEVSKLIVTELSATFGSQLGRGAVGIGVAPATLKE
jgi:DegV family protein with EDD domain